MKAFEAKITSTKGPVTFIEMSGALNETVNMSKVDWSSLKEVVVDLGQVGYFNSLGVSSWLKWVKTLSPSLKMSFARVPFAFVSNVTQIRNFIPESARIVSFIIPFYCNDCGSNTNMIVENKGADTFESITEITKCVECGQEAQMDVLVDKYAELLKHNS